MDALLSVTVTMLRTMVFMASPSDMPIIVTHAKNILEIVPYTEVPEWVQAIANGNLEVADELLELVKHLIIGDELWEDD